MLDKTRREPDRKLLIKGTQLAAGRHADEIVDILIANGKIADIAPQIDATDAEVLDGNQTLATPGFVDGHRHLWQTNLRGMLANAVLADYYRGVRVGYATVYTPDDVYLGVYAGAVDALRDGVTTVLDHCHIINSPEHADAAASALKDAGIRAIFCYGFYAPPVKNPVFRQRHDRYHDVGRIRRDLFPSDDGLVTLGAALTEQWLVPEDVTADEVRTAHDLNLRNVTLHVGANPAKTDIERFRSTKCFGPAFTYSHCVSCQAAFFKFAAETGSAVVSTPETELGMGMGFPSTNKALEAGTRFGLGIDIVSFGNGDMLTTTRLALQTARALHCQPSVLADKMPESAGFSTKDALTWATSGGAGAVGLADKIGSLEVGKQADLVLFTTDRLSLSPLSDAATAIVMHARSNDIDTVIVDGQVRVRGGELIGVDIKGLLPKLEESKRLILDRVQQARSEQSNMSKAYESLISGKNE
ncbi:MAG: amidohydrolase [Rhodospirillales bacterium]|jgi:5-methylthioadenosine/S-adenosylhomocysteine deaminase|nr:amidohydrolase [Rhodospirillales bacterium]